MSDAAGHDQTATAVRLVHDLEKRTSVVVLIWKGGERRLNLAVPYGTQLEHVREAAEEALRRHSDDMARMLVKAVPESTES
jgi:hypothetical protein